MGLDIRGGTPADLYITPQLSARGARRQPDYLREKKAIQELAGRMVHEPEQMLPRFVDLAMELTGGVSAGLSLLEELPAPAVFRWRYLRGVLAPFENATTPRNYSPCGITLDQNGPVLSLHPERFYDWIADANIEVPEVLLVPLYLDGAEPMGTLWIVSAREGHFGSDDARIATELASFVGMALKMLRTEQRLQAALAEQEMLTKEMNHRVKNLFAVSESMVRMTMRSEATKEEMGKSLIGRFHALASAHAMIRRSFSPEGAPPKALDLGEMVRTIVEPHERFLKGGRSRFEVQGPSVVCGEHALNGAALMFHELATNAVKYGALATDAGRISITWAATDSELVFDWRESGGPGITGEPQMAGFGSKLLNDTIKHQFGGSLDHSWHPEGLKVRVSIPLDRLTH
jgi:two-component sensor histidine kinase